MWKTTVCPLILFSTPKSSPSNLSSHGSSWSSLMLTSCSGEIAAPSASAGASRCCSGMQNVPFSRWMYTTHLYLEIVLVTSLKWHNSICFYSILCNFLSVGGPMAFSRKNKKKKMKKKKWRKRKKHTALMCSLLFVWLVWSDQFWAYFSVNLQTSLSLDFWLSVHGISWHWRSCEDQNISWKQISNSQIWN